MPHRLDPLSSAPPSGSNHTPARSTPIDVSPSSSTAFLFHLTCNNGVRDANSSVRCGSPPRTQQSDQTEHYGLRLYVPGRQPRIRRQPAYSTHRRILGSPRCAGRCSRGEARRFWRGSVGPGAGYTHSRIGSVKYEHGINNCTQATPREMVSALRPSPHDLVRLDTSAPLCCQYRLRNFISGFLPFFLRR